MAVKTADFLLGARFIYYNGMTFKKKWFLRQKIIRKVGGVL